MNRLHLDFTLQTTEERASFINKYIEDIQFKSYPPTPAELETMGNYILWGKNPETGKNVKQEKLIQLETRAKTWDSKEVESLDALTESPTFRESQLQQLDAPRFKYPKQNFSRTEARKKAPQHILATLEALWAQIDRYDLLINYYDLLHGKRKNPPRPELLAQFTPAQQESLQLKSSHINQYTYLRMRHLLVEMRREQFTIRDSYASPILRHTTDYYTTPSDTIFDANIEVLPFGLTSDSDLDKKIFNPERFPIPSDFTDEELRIISDRIWSRNQNPDKPYFDFRELEHIYNAFLQYDEIEDSALRANVESTLSNFLSTLKFYAARADLTPLQNDILHYKICKWKNQDIADRINQDYQKTYNANYISTIFRQKILQQINNAAVQHNEVLENIFFPENFKKCKDCGAVLLLNANNFIRKAKSKDGFSVRCKKCDKAKRLGRNQ